MYTFIYIYIYTYTGFPGGSAGKESACNAGDLYSISGLGGCPGEGKGCPLQYSGLENPRDSVVHGVAKSRPALSGFLVALQELHPEAEAVPSPVHTQQPLWPSPAPSPADAPETRVKQKRPGTRLNKPDCAAGGRFQVPPQARLLILSVHEPRS